MKRYVLTVLLGILLFSAAAGGARGNGDSQRTCGTLTVQRIESPFAGLGSTPASEILLYIRFEATLVTQGADNAGSFRSSIITGSRNLPAPNLSIEQQNEIVRRVKSDFSPFNVRVTSDFNEFLAYPAAAREMAVVSTTPLVAGFPSSTLGVAPFNGQRIPNAMNFTFSSVAGDNPIDVASTISHETGHVFGLEHQHLFDPSCAVVDEYHPGFGDGPLRFNPLMGSGFGDSIYNWFAQACPARLLRVPQDDYAKINLSVVTRPDDFPDTPQPGNPLGATSGATGVLEQGGDVDVIFVDFATPRPVTVSSHNIDLKVSLLNETGQVLEVFSDPLDRNIVIHPLVGPNYLKVEAESNANMASQFMIGTYEVTSFVPTAAAASIGGRITTADGRGIVNATLQLTRAATGESKTTRSSAFGWYEFADLRSGETYILNVNSKRYSFGNPSRVIALGDDLTDVDFVSDSK